MTYTTLTMAMIYRQYPPMSDWSMTHRTPPWREASQYQRGPYLVIISDGHAYVEIRDSSLGTLAATGPVPPYTVQGDVPLACVAAAEWIIEEYRALCMWTQANDEDNEDDEDEEKS